MTYKHAQEVDHSMASGGDAKLILSQMREISRLCRQRDELLAALKEIVFVTSPDPDDGSFHENAYSVAINAIAKVEAA